MRRIIDALAIASFVLVVGTLAGGAWGYRWITTKGTDAIIEQVMGKVTEQLPIPKIGGSTGPALPMKGKLPF